MTDLFLELAEGASQKRQIKEFQSQEGIHLPLHNFQVESPGDFAAGPAWEACQTRDFGTKR